MRPFPISLGLMLALLAEPAAGQEPARGVAAMRWLAGCWESVTGNRSMVEIWSPPRGTMMVGGNVSARDGQTRAWEALRIFERDARLVYFAEPSGQQPTEFTATSLTDTVAVFENPAHDFPTRISYHRTSADSFRTEVRGPGPDGPRGFDLRFGRIACTPP